LADSRTTRFAAALARQVQRNTGEPYPLEASVLPFTKRSSRSDEELDDSDSDDATIARAPTSSLPPPPADRPRVFTRSAAADEDMTTLLPRKAAVLVGRPPTPVEPVPMPKLTSSRPPRAMLAEPPTRLFAVASAPPPSVSPVAGPPRSASRSNPPPAPQIGQASTVPQPVPAAPEQGRPSDLPVDPPATVITAGTRIVAARPTMSWAAGLVAIGVSVGLVTAVITRGDGDTVMDATASLVDPSGAHAAGAGIEVSSVQTKADERRTSLVATVDTLVPVIPPIEVRPAVEDAVVASPLPQRPAPAPVVHHWHPASHAAAHEAREAREERTANAAAKAAPAPKVAAPKAARASDEDVESASAADALAKAQLDASLR
jgi:hypothetical protein